MLAYVFWHWRRDDVSAAQYESLQRVFHRALATDPPPGFVRSYSAAIAGAPWANAGGDAYEDWYLVDGSAALDPLEDAAVTASRRSPHDAAAAAAAAGTGGLYRARVGTPSPRPAMAYWFAKPAGMSYAALFDAVAPAAAQGNGALWVRKMVLGPAPELCLQTSAPVQLPDVFRPVTVVLRPTFPELD